jgi:hypothetical protein
VPFRASAAAACYADLGAATSGATFFRTIGGSFGVSVFGAIFSNQLAKQLNAVFANPALAGRAPPGFSPATVQANSPALDALPASRHRWQEHYLETLHPVETKHAPRMFSFRLMQSFRADCGREASRENHMPRCSHAHHCYRFRGDHRCRRAGLGGRPVPP